MHFYASLGDAAWGYVMIRPTRTQAHSHAVVLQPRGSPQRTTHIPRNTAAEPRGSASAVFRRVPASRGSPAVCRTPILTSHLTRGHASAQGVVRVSARDDTRAWQKQSAHRPALKHAQKHTHSGMHAPRSPRKVRSKRRSLSALSALVLALCMAFQPLYIAFAVELDDVEDALLTEPAQEILGEVAQEPSMESVTEDESDKQHDDKELSDSNAPHGTDDVAGDETEDQISTSDEVASSSNVTEGEGVDDASLDEYAGAESLSSEIGEVADVDVVTDLSSQAPSEEEGETVAAPARPSTQLPTSSETSPREPTIDVSGETGMLRTLDDHDCTILADGALYCVARDASTQSDVESGLARVYARAGRDGNKEIFFLEQGRTTQITHNRREDFAPMYDPVSDRIVWNALVDDRLQIMLHDRVTGATRQITHAGYNNSNPQLHGDTLVWQAWKENNWEVMLVRNVSRDPVVPEQLTHNNTHDMFPKVFDTLVTWQTQTRDSWHVAVYDMERRQFSYIEKTGDGRYENPRFVLMFDERQESGDVAVVGYDIATRTQVPLIPLGRGAPEPATPLDDTGEAIPAQTQNGSSTLKTAQRGEGEDDIGTHDLEPSEDLGEWFDDEVMASESDE